MTQETPNTTTVSNNNDPQHDDNAVDLLKRLALQGSHLAQEQASLLQAEVREAANDIKAAIAAMAGAAIIGVAGLGVALMGLAYLLGDAIDNVGLGTLLVGIAALLIALIMYFAGKKKLSAANLKPNRTIRTAEDIPSAATGHMSNAGVQQHDR